MPGTKYYVDIEFRQSGDPGAGVAGLTSKVGESFRDLGGSLVHGFQGAVEKVGGMLLDLGKVGAVGAMGAITYGVAGLNKELETTQVSLAAVLNANGQSAGGIDGAMETASKWMTQMRKDARDLPGEFSDLLGIVQTSAGSAFKIGMDVPSFEKLAASTMAAGKALAVPLDQAGRELAMLMDGRAGGHNILGQRLGINATELYKDLDGAAKKFGELSDAGKIKVLQEKIGAFEPAIKKFADTFDAQWSTLVDNAKTLLGTGTKELFGRVVKDLGDINSWFEEHRGDIEAMAREVGHKLVDAHDAARKIIEEWLPVLKEFASNAYDKFVDMWRTSAPYVKEIAASVKEFLQDKDAMDKLITIGKIYIGTKVAEGVNEGPIGKFAGGMLGGVAGGGGAGVGAGAATGGAALLAMAGVAAAVWQAHGLSSDVNERKQETFENQANMARVVAERQGGKVDYQSEEYAQTLTDAYRSADTFKGGLDNAFESLQHFDTYLSGNMISALIETTLRSGESAVASQDFAIGLQNATESVTDFTKSLSNAVTGPGGLNDILALGNSLAQGMAPAAADAKKKKDAAAGRANITINKVEMTISSNQAPGQVAREVMKQITGVRRYRTSSPGATNFSTAPAGT